jgi:hypothetical protein
VWANAASRKIADGLCYELLVFAGSEFHGNAVLQGFRQTKSIPDLNPEIIQTAGKVQVFRESKHLLLLPASNRQWIGTDRVVFDNSQQLWQSFGSNKDDK